MTVWAERNTIVYIIITRNNVMNLDSVQSATDATPATAVCEKLFNFNLVKTHSQPSGSSSIERASHWQLAV
jgi:hypothetical protein